MFLKIQYLSTLVSLNEVGIAGDRFLFSLYVRLPDFNHHWDCHILQLIRKRSEVKPRIKTGLPFAR